MNLIHTAHKRFKHAYSVLDKLKLQDQMPRHLGIYIHTFIPTLGRNSIIIISYSLFASQQNCNCQFPPFSLISIWGKCQYRGTKINRMVFLMLLVLHSSHLDANIIVQKRENRQPASFLLALHPSFFTRNQGNHFYLMKTPKAVLKYADKLFSDC